MQTYQHSGAVPIMGAFFTAIAGVITAALLGIVYAFALVFIPFIYANMLMTAGFGAGIGWVIGTTARIGKIRNPGLLTSLAVVCSLVGIYCEWGATSIALIGPEVGPKGFHPLAVANMVAFLYENGSWGLGGGAAISGWVLAIIWAVEIVTILGCSVYFAGSGVSHQPFCEICDRWTETETQIQTFRADGSEAIWNELTPASLRTLMDFPLADVDAKDEPVVRLNLATCPACANSNYLTVEKMSFSVDNDGDPQEESEPVIRNVCLSTDQLELVRDIAAREYLVEQIVDATEPPSPLRSVEQSDNSAPSLTMSEV